MHKPLNIIFLGLSGSGKGTQVSLLKEKLLSRQSVYKSSTGDMIRKLKEQDSEVGTYTSEILTCGGLMPKSIALSLWMSQMLWNLKDEDGIIMEGSPRSIWEAEGTDEFLKFLNRWDTTRILHLNVSTEEIIRRLLARGREDDTEEAINGRIAFFEHDVVPVIEYYRKQDKLVEINGEQTPEKIHADIIKSLELS